MTADKKIPPKTGKDVIYIDIDDEITSIIDKVEGAGQKVVALVLPKRATSLQSIVNMRLLKRSADNATKNIVLITSETALLPLAGAAGLHVARNLQSKPEIPPAPGMLGEPSIMSKEPVSEELDDTKGVDAEAEENLPNKIDYQKTIGALAEAHDVESPETIELGDDAEGTEAAAVAGKSSAKTPKNKKLKVPNFDRFRMLLALGVLGLIALIVFIVLAVVVLPKATIAIQTSSTSVSATLNLNTSDKATALDETGKTIPAVLKTSDQTLTQQAPATGQQNNGNKASGSVVFYNCNQADTLSGTVRSIPAGTGISYNGLTFITQQSASVSPSHFIGSACKNDVPSNSVSATAQTGGAKYNVAANTTFAVAGYSTVTGTNSNAFSGGSDNIQTIVAQSDVDTVKQKLTSTSSDSFTKSFETQLSQQGLYVLTSTLKAGDPQVTASPDVGQPATNTTVTVKITYSVLTVKNSDLTTAIRDAFSGQIDKSKQKIEDTDILSGADISVTNQSSPTVATLNITDNTSAVPILDSAAIKKQAEGQKSGDIVASISSAPGVKSVKVKMSPFWVSKAPKNPSKITVAIQHVSGSQ